MELKQLDYFLHLAQTGSVSQSAKALQLSQPSLSRAIAQLEQHLNIVLFERERRPLKLTAAGEFLKKHLEQPLHDIHQALSLTQNFIKNPQRLVIGFVASVLYGLLPEIISQLRQDLLVNHTHLEIKLLELSSEQQITALKSGEIDVGFGRFYHQDRFIQQIFLHQEHYVVAVAQSHDLALQARKFDDFAVSLSSLSHETLILYHRSPNHSPSFKQTDPLLQFFEQKNIKVHHPLRVRDLQIALGLVAASEGITLVPNSLRNVRQEQVCYIPLLHEDITSPILINAVAQSDHFALPILLHSIYRVYERHGITYTPHHFDTI